ncbi:MAG: portal protein [Aeromonas veronii]
MAFFDMFKFWQKEDEDDAIEQQQDQRISISQPDLNDGATEVERRENDDSSRYNVFQQHFYTNAQPKIKTTRDLINTYRNLAQYHEVDNAIQEIVFDAIVFEDNEEPVHLDLSKTSFSEKIQGMINAEMSEILNLYKFNKNGHRLFRRWYVDSRIYFHKILNKDPKKGIQELRILDPRKMEFVREHETETRDGVDYVTRVAEYFIYDNSVENTNDPQNTSTAQRKLKLPRSMVVFANSGLTDASGKNLISYLHKAQKPANQLKMLEDSLVIYRITRAPERRVFYIDVGNMANKKASQHVNNIMQGMKNRVVYDSATGKVKNQHNNLSMTEDYWLMRRDGNAKTEVTTLDGAQSLGQIDDVAWFNKKLYESLHLPLSRIPNEGGGVQFGGGMEITRDELKFGKFVRSLRVDFSDIFSDPLKTNLVLKGIITEEEWEANVNKIIFVFNSDSLFEEQKEAEILKGRMEIMEGLREYVGRYVSNDYILRNVLKMTSDEIEQERKKIIAEKDDEIFKDPMLDLEEL